MKTSTPIGGWRGVNDQPDAPFNHRTRWPANFHIWLSSFLSFCLSASLTFWLSDFLSLRHLFGQPRPSPKHYLITPSFIISIDSPASLHDPLGCSGMLRDAPGCPQILPIVDLPTLPLASHKYSTNQQESAERERRKEANPIWSESQVPTIAHWNDLSIADVSASASSCSMIEYSRWLAHS